MSIPSGTIIFRGSIGGARFEKMPILEALQPGDPENDAEGYRNRLIRFNFNPDSGD
jgi:hypothetical protein